MSQGETKAVETTGYKPMILCASQDDLKPTHALRRLELPAIYFGDNYDRVVAGCGEKLRRPFSVFFAPIDEINCPECVACRGSDVDPS